jgi:phosphopantothenoylcysteine decarboxylase/phosphopantothenate--cysteine ligase
MLLKESKIIVTGGPTREWIDPVRYISNASSGKMGIALADAAMELGREVVFIHGPIDPSLIQGKKYRTISVDSTGDMLKAVLSEIGENSVLVMSAAPADYAPAQKVKEKIKKTDGEITLLMRKTPDILKNVATARIENKIKNIFVAGFAAETTDTEKYARGKLAGKNLDMICLNDVSREGAGFGTDTNIMTLFFKDRSKIELPILTKKEAAKQIFSYIESQLESRR